MPSLARELVRLNTQNAWLDGEAVVMGDDGIPDFNQLQNAFDKKGTEAITYFVFDVLFLDGKDVRSLPLRERRAILETVFEDFDSDQVRVSQTFEADGTNILLSACKMGLEGVIAKKLSAPYREGRTKAWLKVKCQCRQEFVIGGFTTRAGSAREIGSLLLGVYDSEGRLRYAGSVGTGWDSAQGAALLRSLEKLEVPTMPFHEDHRPTKGRWSKRAVGGERWLTPTAVCEVSFTEWTPDGHIRHPTFRGTRSDKPAKAVLREEQ